MIISQFKLIKQKQSLFAFYSIVSFKQIEKLSNFLVLFSFFDEFCYSNFVGFWEEFLDEFLYFFVGNLVGDAEDLEAGTDGAVDEELKFY